VFLESSEVEEARPDPETKQEDHDELYRPESEGDEPRVPLFSRREQFVNEVLADHPLVARAFVNRIWALLLGRGLVHPFDKIDSVHPASHPELLDWLADDFARSGYNVRRLVRHVVLSHPYQLSGVSEDRSESDVESSSQLAEPADFASALEKPLTAEVYLRSMMLVLGDESFRSAEDAMEGELLAEFREQFPDVLPEENLARLQQAMYLSNSPSLQRLVLPAPGNLADRLLAQEDEGARVEQAFQTILGRSPTSDEREAGQDFLIERQSRPVEGIRDLLWAIVMSAEFRLNH
jgi:hypothetical protein